MTTRTIRLQAMLLAVLLAIGAGLVWGVVAGWVMMIIDNVVLRSRFPAEYVIVLRDGTPLIQSDTRGFRTTSTYRTADGKPVDVPPISRGRTVALGVPREEHGPFAGLPWLARIKRLYLEGARRTDDCWYIVHDGRLHGRAYLVGYDLSTKHILGYVGQQGFRSDAPPPDDQFPINGIRFRSMSHFGLDPTLNGVCILTDEGLVRIGWDERSVKFLWKDDNPISVAPCYEVSADNIDILLKSTFLVRSEDCVRELDLDGNLQETFPLPAELRDRFLEWTTLSDGKALAWARGREPDCELFWLDETGIVRRQKVDLQWNVDSDVKKVALLSAIVPVPVVCGVVFAVVPLGFNAVSETGSYWTKLASFWADVWPPILVVVAVGVVLAWLCYRRQRQYGMGWTPAWVVFVFLFGLPGYIGYRTHRRWPACLPCPSCERNVPRDRPACCRCHHDFPAPVPTGTEVFAANNSVL